jgi:methionine sulfoxide reductase heme-binding subunit
VTAHLAAALGPSAYWYLARATGIVSLLLLTASVVLGVLGPLRFTVADRWPRFAIDTVHRDVSLLVIAVLVIHIVTSILDGFAPITLVDAVLPVGSNYRPLWMGLGAFSFDLLIALAVTSLLRRRFGYRAWKAVHWLAYASWPVAVLHGLGTGSDTKASWNLALTAVCVLAVLAAVWARIQAAAPLYGGVRQAAVALTVATPIGLAIFTLAGPLQSGWARRAGTPASLLAHSNAASVRPLPVRSNARAPSSFSAHVSGTVQETPAGGGAIVELALRLSGGASGSLRVRIGGQPVGGGGLSMSGSQVDLLTDGSAFQGTITALQGEQFTARVRGAGGTLVLDTDLQIDQANNTVSGTVRAKPGGAS